MPPADTNALREQLCVPPADRDEDAVPEFFRAAMEKQKRDHRDQVDAAIYGHAGPLAVDVGSSQRVVTPEGLRAIIDAQAEVNQSASAIMAAQEAKVIETTQERNRYQVLMHNWCPVELAGLDDEGHHTQGLAWRCGFSTVKVGQLFDPPHGKDCGGCGMVVTEAEVEEQYPLSIVEDKAPLCDLVVAMRLKRRDPVREEIPF